jgi:hypothetical protein
MALLEATACLFCLNPNSARLGLDKKSRRYMHCFGCGARSFLPSWTSINGIAILVPIAVAITDEIARDRVAWERHHAQIAVLLARVRAQMNGAGSASAETGATVDAPMLSTPIARPA